MVAKKARRNGTLVLTGFVSTGKTTAGRRIADRLALEFIDMDHLIEEREGKSVRALYQERGEAYLREREKQVCAELAHRGNLVIATGGGAFLDRRNLDQFSNAFVVCLDAPLQEIVSRVGTDSHRPLLQGGDVQERLRTLLASRRQAYASIPVHVDTNGMSIDEVVDHVIWLWQERCEPYSLV